MKFYQISIISKNKKSLKKFLLFLTNLLNKLNPSIKCYKQKKRKKVLTILKSPHVNKKAQEQFQIDTFCTSLNIFIPHNFQTLFIIKLIKTNNFSDVTLKIKFIINHRLAEKVKCNIFNPNNFKLNMFNLKKKLKKINIFLNILDIYGELFLATSEKNLKLTFR